ncbi:hypothetical protein KRX57_02335 [Weeksellaceae bacterium TAE3-ERU29]|nr:hypothetical protein [Weeksellaceae bacterium TAE3-ERU29]
MAENELNQIEVIEKFLPEHLPEEDVVARNN